MGHITAKELETATRASLMFRAAECIESVTYRFAPECATMYAYLHCHNGFIVEGDCLAISTTPRRVSEEKAKSIALGKLMLIMNFERCQEIYVEAIEESNIVKGSSKD